LLCNQSHATFVSEGPSQQNIFDISGTVLQHTTGTTSVFISPDVETDTLRSLISMDQQSIVTYLSLKGLNAVEIHNDFAATSKGEAQFYNTVTYYFHKPTFSSQNTPQPSKSPAPILTESDKATSLALSEELFASVRQLASKTHLHLSMVCDHLTRKLGFTVRYLRWVPHLLSEADKYTPA
jgi:hypothetical protein